MTGKRSNGEGSLRKKENGHWEIQVMIGYKPDGSRDIRSFSAPTQKEAKHYLHVQKKYRKKGFVRNRNLFVRQTDDILQVFSLKIFSGGRISTVEFGVVPMCMPLPVFLDSGNYEIHKFCIKNYAEYGGWFHDQKSEASINRCVDELIATVDTYLMPFFDLVIDCKHSLDILSYQLLSACYNNLIPSE